FCVFERQNSHFCLSERIGGEPLEYNFASTLGRGGFQIQDFRMKKGDFRAAFSGVFHKGLLRIKGDANLDNFYQKTPAVSRQGGFMRRMKQFLVYRKWPQKIGICAGGINIFDIKCVLKTHRDHLEIKNINFYFNNHPVNISGDWAWGKEPALNLALLCLPKNPGSLSAKRIKKIGIKAAFAFKETVFDAKMLTEILKGDSANQCKQAIETTFKDATLRLLAKFNLKLSAQRLFCSYSENDEPYAFALKNFESVFDCFSSEVFNVKFKSMFLEGGLYGKAKLSFQDRVLKPDIFLQITKVNAKDLSSIIYPAFSVYGGLFSSLKDKINGKIFCRANYKPEHIPRWQGQIAIQNGYLEDFQFSNWLADFFDITELKKIDFKTILFRFLIAGKAVKLEQISLDSEKVQLGGDFYLKENGLIEGKLSLNLPAVILKTSPKFNLLLALIGNAALQVGFDFQISGACDAINFKWLESDFKNRLQKILPGFIERGIEKKIERIMRDISG
ncbi:MAG: hypothetical protein KKB82_01650, partial [Candidatus Omnitrophica bacterium]|nr:hypothetical protein [Candidatus Omnitrophota bacterium]